MYQDLFHRIGMTKFWYLSERSAKLLQEFIILGNEGYSSMRITHRVNYDTGEILSDEVCLSVDFDDSAILHDVCEYARSLS